MIEKHVTSLELSKKLKSLGIKQESEFYWEKIQKENWVITRHIALMESIDNTEESWSILEEALHRDDAFSAFLSSELGEMLPDSTRTVQDTISGKKDYIVNNINGITNINSQGDTEANTRGKFLIYLIENNLIDVKSL